MDIDKEIKKIIEEYISTDYSISEINDDVSLKNDLGIDSISIIQILILLEDKFNIYFEEDEINDLREYGKLVKSISQKLGV